MKINFFFQNDVFLKIKYTLHYIAFRVHVVKAIAKPELIVNLELNFCRRYVCRYDLDR